MRIRSRGNQAWFKHKTADFNIQTDAFCTLRQKMLSDYPRLLHAYVSKAEILNVTKQRNKNIPIRT